MFYKLITFFALVAVAFASPKPEPQVVYTAPAYGAAPLGVSYTGYTPLTYSAAAGAYPAYPYGYPSYYVR